MVGLSVMFFNTTWRIYTNLRAFVLLPIGLGSADRNKLSYVNSEILAIDAVGDPNTGPRPRVKMVS